MSPYTKSILLVSLQFLFILLLLKGSSLRSLSVPAYIFITSAIFLVARAVIAMQKSILRILPEPSKDAVLIINGPYRYIRHPMYTAVLLGCAGLLVNQFTLLRLVTAIALLIVLLFKLSWEEQMLLQKFEEYASYSKRTKRLIPFLF